MRGFSQLRASWVNFYTPQPNMIKANTIVPFVGVSSCSYNKQILEVDNFAVSSNAFEKTKFDGRYLSLFKQTLALLNANDFIPVDTCSLMRDGMELFLNRFADAMSACHISLSIYPQVRDELQKKISRGDEGERKLAQRALNLISSPLYQQFFTEIVPVMDNPHADHVICADMFKRSYFTNQLLITQDGKLATSVLNLCRVNTSDTKRAQTIVYKLNREGFLTAFNTEQMELSPEVSMPEEYNRSLYPKMRNNWYLRDYSHNQEMGIALATDIVQEVRKPRIVRSIEEYLRDSVVNGVCYITHSVLVDIFGYGGNTAFLNRLQKLYDAGYPVTIYVLSSSLNKWMREKMAPWMHLFQVVAPMQSYMSEEDALLATISILEPVSTGLHHLVICKDASLYAKLQKRIPICYESMQCWGACVSAQGFLLNAKSIYRRQEEKRYAATHVATSTNVA